MQNRPGLFLNALQTLHVKTGSNFYEIAQLENDSFLALKFSLCKEVSTFMQIELAESPGLFLDAL